MANFPEAADIAAEYVDGAEEVLVGCIRQCLRAGCDDIRQRFDTPKRLVLFVENAMHIGLIGGIGPAATDFYYRRLISTFASKKAAQQHEREVQYFKRH